MEGNCISNNISVVDADRVKAPDEEHDLVAGVEVTRERAVYSLRASVEIKDTTAHHELVRVVEDTSST